jgi:hypothetical protein
LARSENDARRRAFRPNASYNACRKESPLSTLVRFLQVFSLGTWVGSIVYFGAIVAPAAFTVLTADQAGALVGVTLSRLHLLGIIAGVIYLLATAVGERSVASLVRPAPLLVFAMIVLTLVLQFYVIGTMDALRAQMGSVSAAAAASPLRASFDRLHTISVRIEMAVLFSGIAALVLTVRKPTP